MIEMNENRVIAFHLKEIELEQKAIKLQYPTMPDFDITKRIVTARVLGVEPVSDNGFDMIQALIKMLETDTQSGKMNLKKKVRVTIECLKVLTGLDEERP